VKLVLKQSGLARLSLTWRMDWGKSSIVYLMGQS